ncbi:MAG: alpha/beta fold hydrolase [Pseudomonadota bacterium]
MTQLRIRTLGEFSVHCGTEELPLPASRKTRALLAYLVVTARPHRRDRLCELLWDIPDDPRAALRWSLSKLRPVVNDEAAERIVADRERVAFDFAGVETDLGRIRDRLKTATLPIADLEEIAGQIDDPFLDGIDAPDQALFQRWLTAEREELRGLAADVCSRLARHADMPAPQAAGWARRWSEANPYDTEAAVFLLAALRRLGEDGEVQRLSLEFADRFKKAGIAWPPVNNGGGAPADGRSVPSERQLLARQSIHFCTAADGARIAYASVGEGAPLVKAANWLSHLELDWDAPIWSPLFRELAIDHQFVRYDERGNGLSDWDVGELSQEAFVTDLETVVDATGLERFALLGISQGAAVSIEYAARHPQRVSHLILFGAYAAGWRIDASEETVREREAVMTLTETGWGQDNPAYRQIFSSTFLPGATAEELEWFNEFQRNTTSPGNAVRFLSAFGDIDVRHRLAGLSVPTLVIHSLGDQRIPIETGRDIAASIPNAEFLTLESDGHLLLGREPSSRLFVDAVTEFIARD